MFSQLKIKSYEKRYLESNYSGGGEHTHSGIDCSGHHKLYGSNSLNVNWRRMLMHPAPISITANHISIIKSIAPIRIGSFIFYYFILALKQFFTNGKR